MCSWASAARRSPTSFGSDFGPTPVSAGTSAGRTAHEPIATRSVPAAGSQAAAEFTIARSCPQTRLTLSKRARAAPSAGFGTITAVTSSPGASAVCFTPRKKSASGVSRVPCGPTTRSRPSSTSSGGAVSMQGEAFERLPATVARQRICSEPIASAPSASAVKTSRMRASSATSCTRTQAPISRSPAGVQRTVPSSGMRLMSTSTVGCGPPRSAIIRSVPPARILAPPPAPASSAVASATVPGLS